MSLRVKEYNLLRDRLDRVESLIDVYKELLKMNCGTEFSKINYRNRVMELIEESNCIRDSVEEFDEMFPHGVY